MKVTKETLEKLAENCNRQAPQKGWKYSIEYAYGRPRLILEDEKRCCRDVSPRLAKRALAEWIWAYLAGIEAVKPNNAKSDMLERLCDSAQCWLDAAANVAPEHLKEALRGNANEFKRVYGSIAS